MIDLRSGVYAITHMATSRQYIGSSVHIHQRWYEHRRLLDMGKHPNGHLQGAWRKYGAEAFAWSVLEFVPPHKDQLLDREQRYLDARLAAKGSREFNLSPKANSTLGCHLNAEQRKRHGDIRRGQPPTPAFLAYWESLRGVPASPERRKNLKPGRVPTPEEVARLVERSHARKGKPLSERRRKSYEEMRENWMTPKRRAAYDRRKGQPWSEKQIAAFLANRDKPYTEKQLAAFERQRGKKQSPELIAKRVTGFLRARYGVVPEIAPAPSPSSRPMQLPLFDTLEDAG